MPTTAIIDAAILSYGAAARKDGEVNHPDESPETQAAEAHLRSLFPQPTTGRCVTPSDMAWLYGKRDRARHDETQEWVVDETPMLKRQRYDRIIAVLEASVPCSQCGGRGEIGLTCDGTYVGLVECPNCRTYPR